MLELIKSEPYVQFLVDGYPRRRMSIIMFWNQWFEQRINKLEWRILLKFPFTHLILHLALLQTFSCVQCSGTFSSSCFVLFA